MLQGLVGAVPARDLRITGVVRAVHSWQWRSEPEKDGFGDTICMPLEKFSKCLKVVGS